MSKITLNCPNCGAPVEFAWASSVQAVCVYCKSILVRTDVDVKKVGEVGDLPNDASPIQIGTEGIYKNLGFVVAGRILYEYENGGWNEWHIVSTTAQADGSLTRNLNTPSQPSFKIPAPFPVLTRSISANNSVGAICSMRSHRLRKHITKVWKDNFLFSIGTRKIVSFADLRATAGRFGTIDCSEEKPLVFIGEALDFTALKLKNLREFEGWTQ